MATISPALAVRFKAPPQCTDICGIATAASPDITDPFGGSLSAKFLKFVTGNLNCLKVIRELRLSCKAMTRVRGSKCSGLSGYRDVRRVAHLLEQRQHS